MAGEGAPIDAAGRCLVTWAPKGSFLTGFLRLEITRTFTLDEEAVEMLKYLFLSVAVSVWGPGLLSSEGSSERYLPLDGA